MHNVFLFSFRCLIISIANWSIREHKMKYCHCKFKGLMYSNSHCQKYDKRFERCSSYFLVLWDHWSHSGILKNRSVCRWRGLIGRNYMQQVQPRQLRHSGACVCVCVCVCVSACVRACPLLSNAIHFRIYSSRKLLWKSLHRLHRVHVSCSSHFYEYLYKVRFQWLEHQWFVYSGRFELVFKFLGNTSRRF